MRRLKWLYFIPILLAILVAYWLVLVLLPEVHLTKTALVVAIPLIILIIGFHLITRRRIRIIRNQLHQILETLEDFDTDEPKKVKFEKSPFPVFNELNQNLLELINRIRSDYQANKQFTQNASHELQTPLAVIKGHVELLLQSPNIKEKEMQSLAAILQNTNRLSKLNSTLILLSKIEHQRFVDTEMLNFAQVADEILNNFHDLIQIKKIHIRKDYQHSFEVEMSSTLAEILIANLIQNAIRHNLDDGFINIIIKPNSFSISNPGQVLNVAPETLFKRFRRESAVEESLGLGLSIVKRICEQFELEVSYTFSESIHNLTVTKTANPH